MTDLERLFSHLVFTIAAADPARLNGPLSVADIQFDIIPYRAHRRALEIDSSEDYEALLLRLFAGEGGLARTEPPEIQARFGQEAQSANPDLRLLREHGEALVSLSGAAVRRVLLADPHDGYAPAPPARSVDLSLEAERELELELPHPAESLPLDEVRAATAGDPALGAGTGAGSMCLYCGGTLPASRQVNYCPHCGQSQTTVRCPECQSDVEVGWRHCVSCGAAVGDR